MCPVSRCCCLRASAAVRNTSMCSRHGDAAVLSGGCARAVVFVGGSTFRDGDTPAALPALEASAGSELKVLVLALPPCQTCPLRLLRECR